MENEIGKRIKNRRKEMKITQTQIYERTGISSSNITAIEKGSVLPSAKTLIGLSEILDCSTDYLLTGKEYGENRTPDIRTTQLLSYFYTMKEDDKKEILMLAKMKADKVTNKVTKGGVMLSCSEEDKEDNKKLA